MSEYVKNGLAFGWGPGVATLNPEKGELIKRFVVGKCLDIGCGSGIYTNLIKTLGLDVAGVDNEMEFVNKAGKKYPDIKFIKSEATELPFKNKEFDTVLLFDIVEHLDEKAILKEAFRVGKRVIVSVPHSNQKLLTKYSLVHSHYLDRTHLRTYTTDSLKSALGRAGAKIVFCQNSLPISVSGLVVEQLSKGSQLKKLLLKIILKPFLPEPGIYSTVFAVAEKK